MNLNNNVAMFRKIIFTAIAISVSSLLHAQKNVKRSTHTYPDSIPVVGIIKNLSDSALLDVI